ncbi:MAG: ChbG/HpnK family deacetylase [Pelolinea sp.]|nr:ChbG/HpnK family deacetylase [Pelolinea sp.]
MNDKTEQIKKRYLIIQADDFGMTRGINRGVIDAFQAGAITNTSLLITMPYIDDAVILAKKNPQLPIGLYLSLTHGHPVLPATEVPTLVDQNGKFVRNHEKVLPSAKPDEIVRELSAQLDKFLRLGIGLSHIETHHGINNYPIVRETVLKIAQEHSVPFRFLTSLDVKEEATRMGIPVSDWFNSLYPVNKIPVTTNIIVNIIKSLKPGITELGCQVGYVDEDLASMTSYVEGRRMELDSLQDKSIKDVLFSENVILMSFYDLKRMRVGK